jgi:hypothetical protein
MSLRLTISTFLGLVCLICPVVIQSLAATYGDSPLPKDHPDRAFAVCAVDTVFLAALLAALLFVVSARKWWWLATLVALPLLILTGALAVTGGMWINGTYF